MEPDLPEPKQPVFSLEERQRRKWAVLLIFLYVLCAYSLIHKVGIPVILKFTRLSETPYARVDLGALVPILLIYFFRKRSLGAVGSLFAGASVAYGIAECYLILKGQYPGWLGLSRLLSSVPLSILGVTFLTDSLSKPVGLFAWSGALVVMMASRFELLSTHPRVPVRSAEAIAPAPLLKEGTDCRPLVIRIGPGQQPPLETLEIGVCGFSPKLAAGTLETVKVKNTLREPVNMHLVISKGDTPLRAGGNWMVTPSGTRILRLPKLSEGEVGMWYSDTHPKLGVAAFIAGNHQGALEITRQPLAVRRIQ